MTSNAPFYDRIARLYDAMVAPFTGDFRRRAVEALALEPEDRLLVVGIGTGLDLEHLPQETRGAGIDLSEGMLERARERRARLGMRRFKLHRMDAQALEFPEESFDAAYLPLIVAVAPDGARILAEAARVAKPGARIVVVDKFWPERWPRPAAVRRTSALTSRFVTHFDRRFSEVHAGAPGLSVAADEPVMLGGFFRLITLHKPG